MKVIDILGENRLETWEKTRCAARGVILKEGRILLSYETVTDQWKLPGGGLEEGETISECCVREIAEETGVIVNTSDCLLEINDYYEEWKWVNRYFICEPAGETQRRLTESEKRVGMEPRWIPVGEAVAIFSRHADYAETDEMRRGMYLREYTALKELLNL